MNEQFRVEGDQEGNGHSDVGTPRVALLIVNYNAGAMLLECLAHVKQQTWSALRVIVLDNDSQDGSLELAEVQFPCFEYVRLGYNSGFAVANNRGIALADDCDWIACLCCSQLIDQVIVHLGRTHTKANQLTDTLGGTNRIPTLVSMALPQTDEQTTRKQGLIGNDHATLAKFFLRKDQKGNR